MTMRKADLKVCLDIGGLMLSSIFNTCTAREVSGHSDDRCCRADPV
jgi:hypothetical protein